MDRLCLCLGVWAGPQVFVEEFLIRRELSDNFCYFCDDYDNVNGAHAWVRLQIGVCTCAMSACTQPMSPVPCCHRPALPSKLTEGTVVSTSTRAMSSNFVKPTIRCGTLHKPKWCNEARWQGSCACTPATPCPHHNSILSSAVECQSSYFFFFFC